MDIKLGWLGRTGIFLGMVLLLTGCGKSDASYQDGMKLAENGEYEKALSLFQKAVKEDSKIAEYHIAYGMTYNYMGKYEEAGKVFETAMDKLKETASKEEKKQFYYGNAVAYAGMGEYQQAEAYCEKALAIELLDDMDGDIRYTMAVCLENQGRYEEAEKVCQKIIKDNKKDWQAYYEVAAIQEKQGLLEEATGTYDALIDQQETEADAYFGLYRTHMAMGNEELAEEAIAPVFKWNVKKASNALAVGRAYYYKKDLKNARNYMEQAYDGNCTESLYYLGVLSIEERNYTEAEKSFLTYIKENEEELKIEVYNQLAVAMMEQKEYDKAQDYISQGLEYGMTEAEQGLRKNQVILYENQKRYDEALEEAQEYVKRYPVDADMKKELAFIRTRVK